MQVWATLATINPQSTLLSFGLTAAAMSGPLNVSPLSGPEEAADLALLLSAASPDIPDDDLLEGLAALLNHKRSGALLSGMQLRGLLCERLRARYDADLLQLAAGALAQAAERLGQAQLLVAASPPATKCCRCGCSALQPRQLTRAAWFYGEQRGPQQGRVYMKECEQCGAQHFLDGYQPDGSSGARRMYPDAALQHPRWVAASRLRPETLVSVQLLDRHLRELHHAATSAQAAVAVYNDLFAPGEPPRACGPPPASCPRPAQGLSAGVPNPSAPCPLQTLASRLPPLPRAPLPAGRGTRSARG